MSVQARERTGVEADPVADVFVRIQNVDRMPPFLMSIPSDSDLWMFISSAGGITAGRTDAEGALFPYETVDKLHESHAHTGGFTALRVRRGDGSVTYWEPFGSRSRDGGAVERRLAKHVTGNQLVFEDLHRDLALSARSRWAACDAFGIVRTVTLENHGAQPLHLDVLDGFRNVQPCGVPLPLQQHSSCLVDAYKQVDVDARTRMGIHSITTRIVDRPEASEQLRANIVWCHGLPAFDVALSADAIGAFRAGAALAPERRLAGRRGHHLVHATLPLAAGASITWHVVGDVRRDAAQIVALRERLASGEDLATAIESAIAMATRSLRRLVGSADGIQVSENTAACTHHFANVLFNTMRGGVFVQGHQVPATEFREFVRARNRRAAERHAAWLAALPVDVEAGDLRRRASATGDACLERIVLEYLPIAFARRHGDPSRPWNQFEIRTRREDGQRALHYEGNWRDIFQNWEALALAFPAFLPHMVAKFVNASTFDGFNPYRLTSEGFEWEVVDPREPWSHIGYWGDHQIVYLSRLLEWLERIAPAELPAMLHQEVFTYANVPYQLLDYASLVRNPHATIRYLEPEAAAIQQAVAALGADGQLLTDARGELLHVSLAEKLLVPVMSKLSNFVPEAGIWMNTQRPEWNDANNALVGFGASAVTLCQLSRHLALLERAFTATARTDVRLTTEVATWFRELDAVLARFAPTLTARACDGAERRAWMDAAGGSFSDYREDVRARGFSGERVTIPRARLLGLLATARAVVDASIGRLRREDGLHHSYSVLSFEPDGRAVHVRPLDLMLEGQVAVLSTGLVSAEDAIRLLHDLFASRLHRPDHDSFMLYPDRALKPFLDRGVIPGEWFEAVPLLVALEAEGDDALSVRDASGQRRFHADFRNAGDVAAALDRMASRGRRAAEVTRDRAAVLALFERVFQHAAFTGRSGRMVAYEGLGSIYWHMVAKLLLAVQEQTLRAIDERRSDDVVRALVAAYERVRGGLGFEKSAEAYGAFPADPYSHTPAHSGAQQPGMTGQVKEEILTRLGELGVRLNAGRVQFTPRLLRRSEFLAAPRRVALDTAAGFARAIDLPPGTLLFTFAQVPVIYHLVEGPARLLLALRGGEELRIAGDELDAASSAALLGRTGVIERIDVDVPAARLLAD